MCCIFCGGSGIVIVFVFCAGILTFTYGYFWKESSLVVLRTFLLFVIKSCHFFCVTLFSFQAIFLTEVYIADLLWMTDVAGVVRSLWWSTASKSQYSIILLLFQPSDATLSPSWNNSYPCNTSEACYH